MKKQWLWILAAAAACAWILWKYGQRKPAADAIKFDTATSAASNPSRALVDGAKVGA
jgi:hypothetical protein